MDPLEAHLAGQNLERLSFWHEVRAALALRSLAKRGGVVADVGAGAGHLGIYASRRCPQVVYRFHEPIDSLAAGLQARFGDDARLGSLEELAEVDLVTLLDVIEHVEDDRGLLAEVIAPLRRGAEVVVTVPALPALWSAWDVELGHHRRYTRATLRAAVRGLDLIDVRVHYLFPELLAPAFVRRLADGRVGSRDGHAVSEYPELPRWIDRVLWACSTVSAAGRRIWPAGTSLVLTARKA